MKLGAQLFSLRTECDTPEKLYDTMKKIKSMGYDATQASAICDIEGERLRSYIDELSLPVLCTHRSFDEIVNNTKKSIVFHKTIGCPMVGLGSMPDEYRGSFSGLLNFLDTIREPVKMIRDAGLSFAYHNHAFEFDVLENGITAYDYLVEEVEWIDFIHDVYWSYYAEKSPEYYIRKIAPLGRIADVHFKDMKTEPKGPICPCGDGIMDFKSLAEVCKTVGIKNVYVEQDNAPELGDVFEQMERSYKHLCPIIKS